MTNNTKTDATRKIELSREQLGALAQLAESRVAELQEHIDAVYDGCNDPTDEESELFWLWRDIHKALRDALDGTPEQDAVWYYERREIGSDE